MSVPRPYLSQPKRTSRYLDQGTRFLKEGAGPESVYEKPYLEDGYREMHLRPKVRVGYESDPSSSVAGFPMSEGGVGGTAWKRRDEKKLKGFWIQPCADDGGTLNGWVAFQGKLHWMDGKSWSVKTSDPWAVVLIENPWMSETKFQIILSGLVQGYVVVEVTLGSTWAAFEGSYVRPPAYQPFLIRGRTAEELRKNTTDRVNSLGMVSIWTPCGYTSRWEEDFSPIHPWAYSDDFGGPGFDISSGTLNISQSAASEESNHAYAFANDNGDNTTNIPCAEGKMVIKCDGSITNGETSPLSYALVELNDGVNTIVLTFLTTAVPPDATYVGTNGGAEFEITLADYGTIGTEITSVQFTTQCAAELGGTTELTFSVDSLSFY